MSQEQDITSYNTTLSTGTGYHVAFVDDRTNFILYLNGNQLASVASGTGTQSGFTAGFSLFADREGLRHRSHKSDEVGVWSRALSASEITQLYNSGSGLSYPFTSNNSGFFNLMM